jgi:hypothetical protein
MGGFALGIPGFVALFVQRVDLLLAIGFGAFAVITVILVWVLAIRRKDRLAQMTEIEALKADLADARRTAQEWSQVSKSVSDACRTALEIIREVPEQAPPRIPRQRAEGEENAA